jgi:hypothetical protein
LWFVCACKSIGQLQNGTLLSPFVLTNRIIFICKCIENIFFYLLKFIFNINMLKWYNNRKNKLIWSKEKKLLFFKNNFKIKKQKADPKLAKPPPSKTCGLIRVFDVSGIFKLEGWHLNWVFQLRLPIFTHFGRGFMRILG